jgi:predicted nucleic acid-binding protein
LRRFFYDTAIFIYAFGGEHPYREPCARILELAESGRLKGEASADIVQEVLHHRYRQLRDRREAADRAEDVADLCRLHDVGRLDVLLATELFAEHPRLSARDAVFAAVALNAGVDAILTTDRGYDGIPGLERIDPADVDAVGRLAAPD